MDQFDVYLEKIQKQLNCEKIKYTHVKHRNELEIPDNIVTNDKKYDFLSFSSKRKGFTRYITDEIKDMVWNQWEIEEKLKEHMQVFIQFIFK